MLTAYSAVTTGDLPRNAHTVFAYANPPFSQLEAVKMQCPGARIVPIATHPDYMAEMYDFENGALVPDTAGHAIHQALTRGIRHPICYFSRANEPTVMESLKRRHIVRSSVRLVVAIGTDAWTYPDYADGVQALRMVDGHMINVYHLARDFFNWTYDPHRKPISV